MTRVRDATGAVIVMFGIASLAPAGAQPQTLFGVPGFDRAIASYMALRHEVQNRVGVPYVSATSTDIEIMQDALASGIRNARPNAKVGDIFSAGVAFEFRRRIDDAIESRGVFEGGFTGFRRDAPVLSCTPAVNGSFDWRFGAPIPTAVSEVLPEVPWPLQYRFVCRDLVLLDVDAGLIVDVLPDALTAQ